MIPSDDGKIKKIQNIILKKILQEIFDVQDNLIIILQSDRFLYICQAASIESFKSCKIIKLNNNCNDINEIARRINFAEQQLAYDKSYDFDKQEFIQIWQQENNDKDENNNNSEDIQAEQTESEKETKTQQNRQKVKKIKKIIKKEKQ